MSGLVAMCMALAVPAAAAASDALVRAEEASIQILEAGLTLNEAKSAPDRVAALTEAVRAYEEGLIALRESVRQATIREQVIVQSFEAEQERLSELLGVLQTLEKTAAPVALVHPDGPIEAARAGMIVADVAPSVALEAERLGGTLRELEALRDLQDSAVTQLEEGLNGIQTARVQLSDAIGKRIRIPDADGADPVLLGLLSASSDSLEAFVLGLAELGGPEAPSGFVARKGELPLPVEGVILRGFEEADRAGIARPGLVVATASQALVVAPAAVSVRYVGTLLDYGNVIVLEPEAGYVLILAGLDQVYARSGEVLPSGAPVGLMGGVVETEVAFGGGQIRKETLYLELRLDGDPVDPAQWFVADED